MSNMQITFNDDDGTMTMEMGGSDTRTGARTTLRDTENGVEVVTVVKDMNGGEHTVVNRLDRATPPMDIMMNMWEEYQRAFLHNALAMFNRARYERLQRAGKPITVQAMCMCGKHLGPEYANILFSGGIVGVPEHNENAPTTTTPNVVLSAEDEAQLRALLDWDDDDETGEAA